MTEQNEVKPPLVKVCSSQEGVAEESIRLNKEWLSYHAQELARKDAEHKAEMLRVLGEVKHLNNWHDAFQLERLRSWEVNVYCDEELAKLGGE